MDFQSTFADIMAKLDSLTQEASAFRLYVKQLKENINRVVIKLETHNQNLKSGTTFVIPTAGEENSDNNESTNSKISLTTKCYKCQGWGHVAANCPSSFKIDINDGVPIETPKPSSIISLKVTHVI